MGNQLCAPWRKVYQEEEAGHWTPKKDSHLLRLWAEIFEVQENSNGEIFWGKVSDDVVPVNITCVQSAPINVFQITSYNRHVEKVFDVKLYQPGTRITQASDCFVHWKDSKLEREWGLNFTIPLDAKRFRDCCSRNQNGRKSISNPTSPVSQPRRAISSPEELAGQEEQKAEKKEFTGVDDLSHYNQLSGLATTPRNAKNNNFSYKQTQSLFHVNDDDNSNYNIYTNSNYNTSLNNYANNYGNNYTYNSSTISANCENIYSKISKNQQQLQQQLHQQQIQQQQLQQQQQQRLQPNFNTLQQHTSCSFLLDNNDNNDTQSQTLNAKSLEHARTCSLDKQVTQQKAETFNNNNININNINNNKCLLDNNNNKIVNTDAVCRASDFSSLKDVRSSPFGSDFDASLRKSEFGGSSTMSKVLTTQQKAQQLQQATEASPKKPPESLQLRQLSREPTVVNLHSNCDLHLSSSSLVAEAAKELSSLNRLNSSEEEDDEEDEEEDEDEEKDGKRIIRTNYFLNTNKDAYKALESLEDGEFRSKSSDLSHSSHITAFTPVSKLATLQINSLKQAATKSKELHDDGFFNIGFDSNTLKRMLQVLPEASPIDQLSIRSRYTLSQSNDVTNNCAYNGTATTIFNNNLPNDEINNNNNYNSNNFHNNNYNNNNNSTTCSSLGSNGIFNLSNNISSANSSCAEGWRSTKPLINASQYSVSQLRLKFDSNSQSNSPKIGRHQGDERESSSKSLKNDSTNDHRAEESKAEDDIQADVDNHNNNNNHNNNSVCDDTTSASVTHGNLTTTSQDNDNDSSEMKEGSCNAMSGSDAGRNLLQQADGVITNDESETSDHLELQSRGKASEAASNHKDDDDNSNNNNNNNNDDAIDDDGKEAANCRSIDKKDGGGEVCLQGDDAGDYINTGTLVRQREENHNNKTNNIDDNNHNIHNNNDNSNNNTITKNTKEESDDATALQTSKTAEATEKQSNNNNNNNNNNKQQPTEVVVATNATITNTINTTTTTTTNNKSNKVEKEAKSRPPSELIILSFETQATFASKSLAVRRTGTLLVQNLLTHKMATVVKAPNRKWEEYFVVLRGTVMLFYPSDFDDDDDLVHSLVVTGCLAYPEDGNGTEGLFSLSTIFGIAFLFKAANDDEMIAWINSLHSACASCMARTLSKEAVCKVLKSEVHRLENSIDLDLKMKRMGDTQAGLVNDAAMKQALDRQLNEWEENLEKLVVEQFLFRCYLSALQDTQLPPPRPLINSMSLSLKTCLSSLGVITPTAFHTAVCARVPLTLTANLFLSKRTQQSTNTAGVSTFKVDASKGLLQKRKSSFKNQRPLSFPAGADSGGTREEEKERKSEKPKEGRAKKKEEKEDVEKMVKVNVPDGMILSISLNGKTTFQDLYDCIATHLSHKKPSLDHDAYFIRVKSSEDDEFVFPARNQPVLDEDCCVIEVCPKLLFQTDVVRNWKEKDLGFSVECASVGPDDDARMKVTIVDLAKGTLSAARKGLQVGDELLMINGMLTSDLDMTFIENLLEESDVVTLTLRSCRCIERSCKKALSNSELADECLYEQRTPSTPCQYTSFTTDPLLPSTLISSSNHHIPSSSTPVTSPLAETECAEDNNYLQPQRQQQQEHHMMHQTLQQQLTNEAFDENLELFQQQQQQSIVPEFNAQQHQQVLQQHQQQIPPQQQQLPQDMIQCQQVQAQHDIYQEQKLQETAFLLQHEEYIKQQEFIQQQAYYQHQLQQQQMYFLQQQQQQQLQQQQHLQLQQQQQQQQQQQIQKKEEQQPKYFETEIEGWSVEQISEQFEEYSDNTPKPYEPDLLLHQHHQQQQQQHQLLFKQNQLLQQQQEQQLFMQQQQLATSITTATTTTASKPMTSSERVCKVVLELLETERQYVHDLNCLIDWYLEPLKDAKIAGSDEIEQLFGNIQEIVHFQKMFLQSLEAAVDREVGPNTDPSKENINFKKVLLALGSAFLCYAHHFKLYSSFCASHSKAQKILLSENNIPLQNFLKSHNPMQQHSVALESYLIKPIQRILKYPLLLKQLKELTTANTEEQLHLKEALHGMEAVAEHINEMQKIYEEYGTVLDELAKQFREANPHARWLDLNVGELQMYGTVNWLNAGTEVVKLRRGMELLTLLFIFRSGVVLMAQEKMKGKRKIKSSHGKPGPSLSDAGLGSFASTGTKYKTAIPVDQLQVRTMVGDAHECHGVWEMIHCGSEGDSRAERIYQFASSQEARRDFIRTIHFSIRDSMQQPRLLDSLKPFPPTHVHESRQSEPRTAVSRHLDSSIPESKHVESRQTASRHNDHKQMKADASKKLPYKTSLKQSRLESVGGICADGEGRAYRHSGREEGRQEGGRVSSYQETYVGGGRGSERGARRDQRGRETGTDDDYRVREYKASSTLQHSTPHLGHHNNNHNKHSSHTLQFHRDVLSRPGSPIWKPRSIVRSGPDDDHAGNVTKATPAVPHVVKQRVAFAIPDSKNDSADTDC